MSPEFINIINQEMAKDYMADLRAFIQEERKTKYVLPAPELLFNAFALCPYDKLKVVIIGEAPLLEPHYDGLAFSSMGTLKSAPEENKEIIYDVYMDAFKGWQKSQGMPKEKIFSTCQLTAWARQGVLLINSAYTCPSRDKFAHKDKGWEIFNEVLISFLNDYKLPLVFVMKCNYDYGKLINKKKHLILDAKEEKWSTKANEFIKKRPVSVREQHHQLRINWTTNPNLIG